MDFCDDSGLCSVRQDSSKYVQHMNNSSYYDCSRDDENNSSSISSKGTQPPNAVILQAMFLPLIQKARGPRYQREGQRTQDRCHIHHNPDPCPGLEHNSDPVPLRWLTQRIVCGKRAPSIARRGTGDGTHRAWMWVLSSSVLS